MTLLRRFDREACSYWATVAIWCGVEFWMFVTIGKAWLGFAFVFASFLVSIGIWANVKIVEGEPS